MTKPTTTVTISKAASFVLREIAEANGVTDQEYLEALLYYGTSIHNRPGSWEAVLPFELKRYIGEDGFADKWF